MSDTKEAPNRASIAKNTERSKKLFLEKFEESKGNISVAVKAANVSRSIYYLWKKDDKDFAEKVEDIIEAGGDYVESKLMMQIMRDNVIATIFYCKTKLKNRGYSEKIEQVGKDNSELNTANNTTIVVTKDLIKDEVKKLHEEF